MSVEIVNMFACLKCITSCNICECTISIYCINDLVFISATKGLRFPIDFTCSFFYTPSNGHYFVAFEVENMGEKPIWEGEVVALYTSPTAIEPMQPLQEASFVEGRGIEGDRRYLHGEADSDDEEPAHEVTLIEEETIEALQYETKVSVAAEEVRRHIVTRGFSVSHLVDREFQVGEVRLRGLSLYEPSPQLMESVGHKIAVSMMHRGGLVAQILSNGVVRVGDLIHE